jgi:hypothetical protein
VDRDGPTGLPIPAVLALVSADAGAVEPPPNGLGVTVALPVWFSVKDEYSREAGSTLLHMVRFTCEYGAARATHWHLSWEIGSGGTVVLGLGLAYF